MAANMFKLPCGLYLVRTVAGYRKAYKDYTKEWAENRPECCSWPTVYSAYAKLLCSITTFEIMRNKEGAYTHSKFPPPAITIGRSPKWSVESLNTWINGEH